MNMFEWATSNPTAGAVAWSAIAAAVVVGLRLAQGQEPGRALLVGLVVASVNVVAVRALLRQQS